MKLQEVRKVLLALLGAMGLCLLLGAAVAGASPAAGLFLVAAGMVLFFVFMGYSFSQWRCPHCGEFLGWSLGKDIPICPFCARRLDKEE